MPLVFRRFQSQHKALLEQIKQLEKQIKGTVNVRENLPKMTTFPMAAKTKPRVNNLSNLFEETIKTTGPIPLSTFMRQCLTHPEFGYYTTRNPLDKDTGDFITSPEVSSVFGEMIGIYMFQIWQIQGQPKSLRMIEFGPGRGTLMHDMLLSFNKLIRKFGDGVDIEIEMIETSRVLRREQHRMLCESPYVEGEYDESVTKWGNRIKWIENESEVTQDDRANFVVAHEFFDALPIKSFEKTEHGWREFMVDHSPTVENMNGPGIEGKESSNSSDNYDTEFHLTLSPKETPSSKLPEANDRFKDLPVGSRIEMCPDAEFFVTKMAKLVNNTTKQGSVLIIDYGVVGKVPDVTLRGIYKHKFVSPFYLPGSVDLSIDVDFDGLGVLAQPYAQVLDVVDQGDWLHEMGVGHRIHRLIQRAENEAQQQNIYDSYVRLTDKEQMGGIYKFMALVPKGQEVPLGFQKLV